MNLQYFPPPLRLAPYVAGIFVMEDGRLLPDAGFPLFANGYPCISFQLSDAGALLLNTEKASHLVLMGQTVKPARLYTTGRLCLISYFLYPHVLKAFFGFDVQELTDIGIDPGTLPLARKMNLEEQLLNAASVQQRLHIMNVYMTGLIEESRGVIREPVVYAAQAIQRSRGLLPLEKIRKEVYLSERSFRRLFEDHIGVSPKIYSRITQFDAAFRQLNATDFARLSDIAFENGYADQSHLVRSFKEFTGLSPRAYLKSMQDFLLLNR